MLHVSSAEYLGGHRIKVKFNNGMEGIVDLFASMDGGIFSELRDESKFRNFHVDRELGTIVWQNGADLAPEYLFYLAFQEDEKLSLLFEKWGYKVSALV